MTTTPAIFKKSSDIAEYLTAVLQGIRTADGYNTDIGTTVYRGRLKHDEDRVPYAVLIEGEDRPILGHCRRNDLRPNRTNPKYHFLRQLPPSGKC